MNKEEQQKYNDLTEAVERVTGRKMKSPRDFDYLSTRILHITHTYIAPITLKRFWGYLGEKRKTKPYRFTLNTLAQYSGFSDFETFCKSSINSIESHFINNKYLNSISLEKGTIIKLYWLPDRCITIRYEGMNMYRVVESINSKLSINDTFLCEQIIEQEPLYLRCLVHENETPCNYICGKINGVKFTIIDQL